MQYHGIDSPVIETKVQEVITESDKLFVNTTNSNLRHRYGGQLEDYGYIYVGEWLKFNEVLIRNSMVYGSLPLECASRVSSGMAVMLKRDEVRRDKISRMHTIIHMLTKESGLVMLKGYAGPDVSRVDFAGDIDSFLARLESISYNIRMKIKSDLKVNTLYLSSEEIVCRGDVEEFNPRMPGLIRVTEIESYDARVCLGTHVQHTRHIGLFNILPPIKLSEESFKINFTLV